MQSFYCFFKAVMLCNSLLSSEVAAHPKAMCLPDLKRYPICRAVVLTALIFTAFLIVEESSADMSKITVKAMVVPPPSP